MKKKITLILLVFFLTMSAISVVPLPTSAANLIINGTFEGIDSDTGYLRGWRVEESAWGTALSVCSTEKFSGQYALKMISQNNEEVSIYEYSATQDLIPGSRYKLAFWYKDDYALGTAAQIALTTQFINANNRGIAGSNETETISASKSGKWLSYIKYVTIPSDAKRLYVKIGVTGGKIYIDDLLCDQQSDIGDLEAGENLVNNGGFEDSAKNTPDQWNYRTLASGHSFSERTNEKAHTGDYSLKIQCDNTVTEEAKTKPFAWENVYNVEPLATYKLSTYLNISAADGTANALFKCEYYKRTVDSDELECVGSNHSDGLGQTLGQWLRVEKTITIPAGASVFRIYCRLFGNGIAYFDDISLIKVAAPKAAVATTDKIFFYSDMTEYGNISVTLNTETYPELTGGKIDFTITDPDGNIKVSEEQDIDSNNTAVFSYSSDTLSELKSAYTIHATPKTAQGVQIGEPATQKIYKYARPQYLDRDGVYRVNNEIFNPTVVYHCPVSAYSTCKDLGINVVQATESNVEAAKEAGLKVLLVLYSNMIAAGAPENIENTKRVVAKYKDDPAIFAYAIMDEPRAYYPENDRSALENSYVAIRNIDDKHPVWITDSPGGLGTTSEYCDIFCHEVYENEKLFDTSTKEKLGGNRALYSLVRIPEDKNIDTIRSRVFSSIAFGATGFGYFIENYSSLLSEELYESLKNMTEYEISHVEEAFVNGSTNT
ncbi:MAG: carbohydrate binding domain-containing protein, partial [Clostridia bacterium]|nr:carbohydrate binding domain-containing protein [Clostridia bacterium]